MEIVFMIDILRNFLMEYYDPREPRKPIRDCGSIAVHYIKAEFVFDVLAILAWPLRKFFDGDWEDMNANLLYLLRLLRLSKILIILNL